MVSKNAERDSFYTMWARNFKLWDLFYINKMQMIPKFECAILNGSKATL